MAPEQNAIRLSVITRAPCDVIEDSHGGGRMCFLIAAVAVHEGVDAWRGEQCDDCAVPAAAIAGGNADSCGCGPGCTDACCTPRGSRRRLVEDLAVWPR